MCGGISHLHNSCIPGDVSIISALVIINLLLLRLRDDDGDDDQVFVLVVLLLLRPPLINLLFDVVLLDVVVVAVALIRVTNSDCEDIITLSIAQLIIEVYLFVQWYFEEY